MKRCLLALLALCVLLTALPGAASAETRELTDADWLAFSAVSNLDFFEGETVREALLRMRRWDTLWSERQGISYAQLCAGIASYRVAQTFDYSLLNGFYAVLFTDGEGNGVLAYRGSAEPARWAQETVDAMHDWLFNDLPIELGNLMGSQYDTALETFRRASERCESITVTGHSLGGAWADVASAVFGCRGVTFNAVSVLDVLFTHDPVRMAACFDGIDRWNFVDHTNEYDIWAGMFETYCASEIKPYVAHQSNVEVNFEAVTALRALEYGSGTVESTVQLLTEFMRVLRGGELMQCHMLDSFVTVDASGTVCLTEETARFVPASGTLGFLLTQNRYVQFGSTGGDTLDAGALLYGDGYLYGGDGSDRLTGSIRGDVLIGGNGDDCLEGDWGDDRYLYRIGSGYDVILDVAGNDTLELYGVTESDVISVVRRDGGMFADVLCNATPIVSIALTDRASGAQSFAVMWNGNEQDISAWFTSVPYVSRTAVDCNASVRIVADDGTAVLTVGHGTAERYSGAFGTVSICGEGTAVVNLVSGYRIKLIGTDGDPLSVHHKLVYEGAPNEVYVLSYPHVPASYTAELVSGQNGEPVLRLENACNADLNGDGKVNVRDYMLLKRFVLGKGALTEAQKQIADLNFDGKINVRDYVLLKRFVLWGLSR